MGWVHQLLSCSEAKPKNTSTRVTRRLYFHVHVSLLRLFGKEPQNDHEKEPQNNHEKRKSHDLQRSQREILIKKEENCHHHHKLKMLSIVFL